MKIYLVAYAAAAAAFLAADAIWLGFVAREFYRVQLGELMAPDPNLVAAAAFYLLYVVGVVYFAISPALASGQWTTALVSGALFGLVAYGTYDLTNLAVTRGFPMTMAIVDMTWGAILTAFAATVGFFAAKAFG
ncbi:DUF2177 family protein [Chenggangzhangella methanolivorans]|uniref:DUF2177 family protein n=1 Tax=Chenggangzhangella methanolivorans TaxID=1437009 RepID=A0A9E6RAP0_9HYPH|nr:DUF2177 family protein [Chenggangzhangella methanolivorans]QZO00702.1 DUF2177 family protein [Chenggangzhangella methanolivorans]